MSRGIRGALLSGLLAATVIGGTLGSAGYARTQAAGTVLRVGYFPNITHAQAILGFGQGTFARELRGVDVQGKVFNAGGDEINAIFAGAVDIGYIGPGPALNLRFNSGRSAPQGK